MEYIDSTVLVTALAVHPALTGIPQIGITGKFTRYFSMLFREFILSLLYE